MEASISRKSLLACFPMIWSFGVEAEVHGQRPVLIAGSATQIVKHIACCFIDFAGAFCSWFHCLCSFPLLFLHVPFDIKKHIWKTIILSVAKPCFENTTESATIPMQRIIHGASSSSKVTLFLDINISSGNGRKKNSAITHGSCGCNMEECSSSSYGVSEHGFWK